MALTLPVLIASVAEVSIVAHIMQLALSGLKWPLNFLSCNWLSQLHLFIGFRSSPHNVASVFSVEMALINFPSWLFQLLLFIIVFVEAHIMQCIHSEVSIIIVAHIMLLAFSWLK